MLRKRINAEQRRLTKCITPKLHRGRIRRVSSSRRCELEISRRSLTTQDLLYSSAFTARRADKDRNYTRVINQSHDSVAETTAADTATGVLPSDGMGWSSCPPDF